MTKILFAAVLLILGGSVINGYHKGILKMALSIGSFILAMFLVSLLQPVTASVIRTYTPIERITRETIESNMEDKLAEMLDGSLGKKNGELETQAADQGAPDADDESLGSEESQEGSVSDKQFWQIPISENQQQQWLDMCNLPELIQRDISTSAQEAAGKFAESVSTAIAAMIINCLSYLLTFLLVFILIRVIIGALDLISRVPGVHGVNKFLGAGVGLLEGLIILWLICMAITAFLPSSVGYDMMDAIKSHPFLVFVYDHVMKMGDTITHIF